MRRENKFLIFILTTLVILLALPACLYLWVIPTVVGSPNFLNYIQKAAEVSCGAELIVEKPVLETSIKPYISMKADSIILTKEGKMLFNAKNLDSKISLKEIISKKIILDKLGADDIYVDINALQELSIKEGEKAATPLDIKFEWFNALLYIKKCMVLYRPNDKVNLKILARDLEITKERNPKYVHFTVLTDIDFNNKRLRLLFKDFDTIYTKDRKFNVDNFKFRVNKSEITVNGYMTQDNKYDFEIKSDKFDIKNIDDLMNSNLVIPNGSEIMSNFKDMQGDFNFKFKLSQNGLNGQIKLNKGYTKLVPMAELPITVDSGNIELDSENIKLSDIKGFYGKNPSNKVEMYGSVKKYMTKADTEMILQGDAQNELAQYISKLAGCKIELKGLSKFALKIAYDISGKVTVKGGGKVPKGSDLLLENMSISPTKFDRAIGIDLEVLNDKLKINHINYYIADNIAQNIRPNRPLVTVNGDFNAFNGEIYKLEFDLPEALPSEFFNVLISQRLFRNGTISGKLKYINQNVPYPQIVSDVKLKDVRIVGQRLSIKEGTVTSNKDFVKINAKGRFRRTDYDFAANIKNRMLFPVIVKNVNLNIDEIDVERVMKTFAPPAKREARSQNSQNRPIQQTAKSDVPLKYFEIEEKQTQNQTSEDTSETEPIVFQPGYISIEDCNFNVKKGQFKQINFGDLHAKLSLTESGILEIKSNKFNFAEGISTLKVYCDMVKQKYSVRLGAKDVDSNAIAASTLNLPNEISGKASALLEFYTDDKFKLNGKIQFAINDGSITKLGLVQYILNMAALFRNPIVMISPSTLLDLINIPEGTFKKISGNLVIENNVVERMMIKSSSPQLSSFIVGRMNLENMDASLRIYTKFSNKNKGFAGFLRGFSLNALAKKASSATNLENVSYYAAELSQLPELEIGEEDSQVFLTKVDGDIQTTNFLSSLKKIK